MTAPLPTPAGEETLSVDELARRVGMSVRTVRFYAGRGLIPPPRREGRNGYYGPGHLARLELVRELQAHGFTLSAIEGYLDRIPAEATPQQVALHRTLLAPWSADLPERLDLAALTERVGRRLSDEDLELLAALGVIEPTATEDVYGVATAHLALGVQMLELGIPTDAARNAHKLFNEHGRALAEELTEIFRTQVWPHYRQSGRSTEELAELVELFKPLTVQALVLAYEHAVNETKRDRVRRRR